MPLRYVGADSHDFAAKLVPGNVRQDNIGIHALPSMVIATANTTGQDLQDHASCRTIRICNVLQT